MENKDAPQKIIKAGKVIAVIDEICLGDILRVIRDIDLGFINERWAEFYDHPDESFINSLVEEGYLERIPYGELNLDDIGIEVTYEDEPRAAGCIRIY